MIFFATVRHMMKQRRCLGEINAELSKEADQVTEVVCGILLHQKEAVNEPVVEQL